MGGTQAPRPHAAPVRTERSRALHAPPAAARGRTALVAAELLIGLHLLQVAATSDLSAPGRLVFAALVVATMAAVLALSTGASRGRRALGMLVAGSLGTMSGAAVGAMHALATGFSLTAVLGVAALVAGLALLVTGVLAAVRVLPGWWRLLALPIAVVVLQLVVLTVPFALYVTHVPIEPFAAPVPEGAVPVRIETTDGASLAAWYTPSENGAAVVLRHGSGAGSSKASTVDHAAVLVRHGYGVLAMDARGHGESGGRPMDWGWYGEPDVAAGVGWLTERSEVEADRIGGVGLSMGGEELLGAAGADPRLRAVVAEGATGRTAADRDLLGQRGYVRVVDQLTAAATFGATDLLTRASSPTPLADGVDALSDDRRALLITGEDPTEATVAHALRDVAGPDVVTVWEVADAPHTAALTRHASDWEERVIGFLDAALG
jgi:uncharacterized protein